MRCYHYVCFNYPVWFLKLMRKSLLYVPIVLLFPLFFYPQTPRFCLFSNFLFVWGNFFSQSSRICLLITKFKIFSLSENIFISSLFLKDSFTRYWIFSLQFFSFSTWKILCHFFLTSMVSDEKSTVIQMGVPLQIIQSFSLAVFKVFFFIFTVQKFNYDISWHGFLCVYHFWGLLSVLDL